MKYTVFILFLVLSCGAEKNQGNTDTPSGTDPEGDSSTVSLDSENGNGDGDTDTYSDGDTDTDSDGDSDADGDTDGDTDADADTDTDSDTDKSFCPEGSVQYTTAGGEIFCCNDSYPVFCDENDVGYGGGCWGPGVDCETVVECGGSSRACLVGSVPYCDQDETFACYSCPVDATRYETASGKPVCCSPSRPTFCDENADGYTGGCWSEAVDCETITTCGGSFTACVGDTLPYCDDAGEFSCYACPDGAVEYINASGKPICCGDERPLFCDENANGYSGGCWNDGVDCSTVISCGGFWGACMEGRESVCEEDALRCLSTEAKMD